VGLNLHLKLKIKGEDSGREVLLPFSITHGLIWSSSVLVKADHVSMLSETSSAHHQLVLSDET
jgi:hypothetical protein